MSTDKKNKAKGLFPFGVINGKKWWNNDFSSDNLTKAGAVATQEQCSSGGGGNGRCGIGTKSSPNKNKR